MNDIMYMVTFNGIMSDKVFGEKIYLLGIYEYEKDAIMKVEDSKNKIKKDFDYDDFSFDNIFKITKIKLNRPLEIIDDGEYNVFTDIYLGGFED